VLVHCPCDYFRTLVDNGSSYGSLRTC
jgi:hypothetical protein